MKIEMNYFALSLIVLGSSSCHGFVTSPGGRVLVRPGYVASNTLRHATADALDSYKENNQDDEIERLRSMAAQLRAEASALAAEQALKVSEGTQQAFAKFDLNNDGEICVNELKLGLDKAFKTEIPQSQIEKLITKLDKNGDGVLQLEEFLTVDQMRNQLDALIREEKAVALEEAKLAKAQEEAERLREMQVAILNDGEPTTKEKFISIAPYLFPLLDSLQFANLFVASHQDNGFAQAAAVLYTLYRSIPFGGFLCFLGLSFLAGNPTLNRLIRFNMQQAIYLDIALFFPALLTAIASGLSLNLPMQLQEYGNDAVVVAMLASVLYASVSSLLGQTPDKLPFVSKASSDRMISPEDFDIDIPPKK